MTGPSFKLIVLTVLSAFLFAFAQDAPEIKELIEKITYNSLKKQYDGEYKKGSWQDVINSKPAKHAYWSYPTGVSMYALQRAYDILQDKKIIDYVNNYFHITANRYAYYRWQKYTFGVINKTEDIRKLWRLSMLDDCGAMGTAILDAVMYRHCEVTPQLKEMIDIFGNYVVNVQARLEDGAFWRPESEYSPTIWVDDIYMGMPFLAKWAEYTKDDRHFDDVAKQILSYASYLQDERDGMFYHGYYVKKQKRSCCKWCRGNGWAAAGIAIVLSSMPEKNPYYNKVMEVYKKLMAGIKTYQAEDGLWHQVVDHPELSFGTETSGSAQFTFAVARGLNKGWLDRNYVPVVEKAIQGLRGRVTENGGINKVCRSTVIGDNLQYYNNRPIRDNDHHGHGLMLLALTEVYYLLANK